MAMAFDRHGRGSFPCQRCERLTRAAIVRTNIWLGERLVVVEDIPAQLCEQCGEQYYDEMTSEALRALVLDDLDSVEPKRVMEVNVYSMEGRIPEPPPEVDELKPPVEEA